MSEETKGASNDEQLLAAARDDNEELLLEVFQREDFNINCVDGLGNTPLHIAVSNGSTDVLEHILSHQDCDVDPINRIGKATPLHLAVQLEPEELRHLVVESLLDAGADTSIKDKNGEKALDLVPGDDLQLREIFRKFKAQASISHDDIADDDDDDGEPGSDSDED